MPYEVDFQGDEERMIQSWTLRSIFETLVLFYVPRPLVSGEKEGTESVTMIGMPIDDEDILELVSLSWSESLVLFL